MANLEHMQAGAESNSFRYSPETRTGIDETLRKASYVPKRQRAAAQRLLTEVEQELIMPGSFSSEDAVAIFIHVSQEEDLEHVQPEPPKDSSWETLNCDTKTAPGLSYVLPAREVPQLAISMYKNFRVKWIDIVPTYL